MITSLIIHNFYINRSGKIIPEYQDIIDFALSIEATIPSFDVMALDQAFIRTLKNTGIWERLDVLYPFATDGDNVFAVINWKDPSSFILTNNNNTVFTAKAGFTGNGSDMYLSSAFSFDSAACYSRNSASFGYYKSSNNNTLADLSSDGTVSNDIAGGSVGMGVNYYRINSSTAPGNAGGVTVPLEGFKHFNRSGEEDDQSYINGELVDSSNTASIAVRTGTLTILRRGTSYSGSTLGLAWVGGDLSDKAEEFYNAWNARHSSL